MTRGAARSRARADTRLSATELAGRTLPAHALAKKLDVFASFGSVDRTHAGQSAVPEKGPKQREMTYER